MIKRGALHRKYSNTKRFESGAEELKNAEMFSALSFVGLLQDEVDPMVSVMKVEKTPFDSYESIEFKMLKSTR